MNHIINPIDGVKYSLFSEIGKNIFKNYLNAFKSGGAMEEDVTLEDIETDVDKLSRAVEELKKSSDSFEYGAARVTEPKKPFTERYDSLNTKLNKMWKHHVVCCMVAKFVFSDRHGIYF